MSFVFTALPRLSGEDGLIRKLAPGLLLALAAAALILGLLYRSAASELAEAVAREKSKDAVIAALRNEPAWIGKIMTGFEHERTDIEDIRKAARRGVRDELRASPLFRAWASGALPAAVAPGGGLLGAARAGNHPADASPSASAGTSRAGLDGDDERRPAGIRAGSGRGPGQSQRETAGHRGLGRRK